jgi:L,D-peptidoglycan transpeptidase YkuD (ErfK/YbiS/YcfS/YnhG family)
LRSICDEENVARIMQLSRRRALAVCGGGLLLPGCVSRMPVHMIAVSAPAGAVQGTLRFGALEFPCALGRSGIVTSKREGDGGTPAGTFPLREVRYRADRGDPPRTKGLQALPIRPSDGWCDAPGDPSYNRLVQLPYAASAEHLWRDDHLYDVLAVIGYNDSPPVSGMGSAIFLHVARTTDDGKFAPTVGCVALRLDDLLAVLADCVSTAMIEIRLA